jgi:hypothetical protein
MDQAENVLWRLDAWDSRAGRAFLCRRIPDGEEDPRLDQPTVFVCPPFFQPEPLASRAPGFAASRGTAQLGFFIDGVEVGFATLADAIAFVRRAYNSTGFEPLDGAPVIRREGPAGGGGSGLARELPELPVTMAYRPLDLAIAKCKVDFLDAGNDAEWNAAAVAVKWHVDEALTAQAIGLLELAGEALMRELLWRFPTKGTTADYSVWLDAATRLGRQLFRLGLWKQVSHRCASQIKIPVAELANIFALGLPANFAKEHSGQDALGFVDTLFGHPHRQLVGVERTEEAIIYEDLRLLPLPPSVAGRYPARVNNVPTVLTLLSTWFAHPNSIEEPRSLDRALLLFGGACVVVGRMQRQSPMFKPWWIDQNPQVQKAFETRLGSESWKWISQQLPDRTFHSRLEEALQEVARIWMHVNTIGPSDKVFFDSIEEIHLEEIRYLRRQLGEILADDEYDHEPGDVMPMPIEAEAEEEQPGRTIQLERE